MVDATLTLLDRGTIRTDANFAIEGHTTATMADPDPETRLLETPVYNLVIDHPEGTMLWDTGSHPDAGDGHWPADLYAAFEHDDADEHPLEEELQRAGYALEDIDYVFQSHLDPDHAGGLRQFAGTDVPVFVHEEELKYAYYSAKTDEGSDAYVLGDFDHELNWQVLHRDRETHFEDIEFVHLPGHTPGLTGLVIHLDDFGTAILTGDQAYLRANYDDERPLGGPLLWSKRHWRDSLSLLKELERKHDAEVFCGHAPADVERLEGGLP